MSKNYRNGHSKKTVKTQLSEVTIDVPRDRNGKYEPSIISKYSRNADGYRGKEPVALLMRYESEGYFRADKNLYDVEISPERVSKISEKRKLQLGKTARLAVFIHLYLWMRYITKLRKTTNM